MNSRVSSVAGIQVAIGREGITMGTDKESVPFTPAEAEAVASLLATANSMSGLKVFPPHITSTPFRIIFNKGGDMILFKRGQKNDEGYPFKFRDVDSMVRAVNEAVKMFRDEQIHRGGPRAGRAADTSGEPPMEGLI